MVYDVHSLVLHLIICLDRSNPFSPPVSPLGLTISGGNVSLFRSGDDSIRINFEWRIVLLIIISIGVPAGVMHVKRVDASSFGDRWAKGFTEPIANSLRIAAHCP